MLLATGSFDTKIAFLRIPALTIAFELCGHVQGVQHLDYFTHGGLFLSSGFEHQAYCWNIHTQSLLTHLGGHQASLISAKFVSHPANATIAIAVTGDERGHFRLWDLTRCLKGHATNLATPLQSFDVVTPNLCRFRSVACGMTAPTTQFDKKKAEDSQELVDIITGSFRLFRFRAVTHVDESAPPRHVAFNSISNCFVGSVDGVITVWSAHSGDKIEEPIAIRDADVCGVAFDLPRQRKLFVATSDGAVRLYNPITAILLTKTVIHDGRISSLIYCQRSSCLITTGYDRRLSVSFSSAGKTDVEVLRTVDNAHDSCITAAAYSEALELIATGDDSGGIHLYDFERLYLVLRCVGHTEDIRALQFHCAAVLLFSADARGVVYVWYAAVGGEEYQVQPIMELKLFASGVMQSIALRSTAEVGARPSTAPGDGQVPTPAAVSSILTTFETKQAPAYVYLGTANGLVWGWDFRVLVNHARKLGIGKCFEYRFHDNRSWRPDGGIPYNAMLRVKHKASIVKVRSSDVGSSKLPFNKTKNASGSSTITSSCDATLVWQAHSGPVEQLLPVPHPAQIFSASTDGTVKVWDASNACLGTISTQGTTRNVNQATRAAASTWKFSYHHHMANETREQQVCISRGMLRRVKRRAVRQQQKRRESGSVYDLSGSSPHARREEPDLLTASPTATCELPSSLVAAEKLLATHTPFSKLSLRSGMHEGLFGPEEAAMLRELSQSGHGLPSNDHDRLRLAPLMVKSPTPDHRSKSKVPLGNEHELPMMRTLRHFPIEVERRRAKEKRQPGCAEVDTSMSQFLRDKLSLPDTPLSPAKSTSKKKAIGRAASTSTLSMKMDASVVVTEEILLPAIRHRHDHDTKVNSVGVQAPEREEASSPLTHSRRSSYASAPCLPVHQPEALSTGSEATSSSSLTAIVEAATGASRPNIERKMRIYETVVGDRRQRSSADPLDPERTNSESESPPRRTLLGRRQLSQPVSSTDVTKFNGTLSPKANRKRSSHAALGSTLSPGSPTQSNPFAPHYTARQVMEFGAILARFDNDSSGDIDKSEWVRMLQNCRRIFGSSDVEAAERLFHSIDRDDSGKISLQEILPMMFSKATPEQLHKMRQMIHARPLLQPEPRAELSRTG